MKLIDACSLDEKLWQTYTAYKKQKLTFVDQGLYSQSNGFSSNHIWMWEMDHKEGWVPKNWSFWTVVLEKTLESPLDCKIKPINPKGNQLWIFIERPNAEALILWPLDAKGQLIGKDPDTGKDWRQEEKGMAEDEMVGWHQWLNGHDFEQALGDGEGQGRLASCHSSCHEESDLTEWLNNNNNKSSRNILSAHQWMSG